MPVEIVRADGNTSGTILELDRVGKTFHADSGAKVTALERIDLAIRCGEFVTLVGPTGCGKTTLLDIAAGITEPEEGHVYRGPGVRLGRNVAYVFQHYTLFPWRTTLANVAFGLQMRGVPRRQRRTQATELLARVGLAGFEKARPHELSGGMRQRAAIAQALAIEPALLLMDEPFGAVDDATRTELQQMLVDLWQDRGMTILFVTHNIDEAILLGSRVVVFGGPPGRVVRQFSIELPRPRDRDTRRFTELFLDVRHSLSTGLD
jgi:NitT/TauT family transport system ATP-binding protein